MSQRIPPSSKNDQLGQPAWRIALFFPEQGGWTEADYFALDGGPLVEFDDGTVEVLDMPTKEHQRIVQFLFLLLQGFVAPRGLGEVFVAPLPVRLWPRKFREPDVVFIDSGRGDVGGYPDGADLVIEVVSEGNENRKRDLEIKPIEYAQAGIDEYWVVDPQHESMTIHRLVSGGYQSTTYHAQDTIASTRLAGLTVTVSDILAAAKPPTGASRQ